MRDPSRSPSRGNGCTRFSSRTRTLPSPRRSCCGGGRRRFRRARPPAGEGTRSGPSPACLGRQSGSAGGTASGAAWSPSPTRRWHRRRARPLRLQGSRPFAPTIPRPASSTSIHVGEELPAHADFLRLRLGDDAFRRRQDQDAEILGREIACLVLLQVRALHGEPRFDHTAIVDAADERHAVKIPAAVLDEFERLDVPVVLHHLQDPADQLRRWPDHAFRLAGRLRVPDRRHRIVERVLQHPITSTVLPEAELICDLAETLAAEMESVASDNAPLAAAPETALLPAEILRPLHSTTSTLKRSFMNWMPSARDTRCRRGTGRGRFARRETRHPGRCRLTPTSIPNTPIPGSYFILGNPAHSWIPNEKFRPGREL